jgi:uncharacterized protein YodC (DUF2158 family)
VWLSRTSIANEMRDKHRAAGIVRSFRRLDLYLRLKSGGAQMTISKLFKSPEGHEMVQCTWFDKKPREQRAAFVIESLVAAEEATLRASQAERA